MADAGATPPLSDAEKSARSKSFGSVADHYERYRPGPPPAIVAWFLPEPADCVVDLGAGTGALTRLLTARGTRRGRGRARRPDARRARGPGARGPGPRRARRGHSRSRRIGAGRVRVVVVALDGSGRHARRDPPRAGAGRRLRCGVDRPGSRRTLHATGASTPRGDAGPRSRRRGPRRVAHRGRRGRRDDGGPVGAAGGRPVRSRRGRDDHVGHRPRTPTSSSGCSGR